MEQALLIEFLLRAKKSTYAGDGTETLSSRPASHDLHYREGNLLYIDSYLGSHQFAGQEALWQNGKPLWAMNYSGRVLGEGFSGAFLKQALGQVTADQPYRGPREYVHDEHRYSCQVQGGFEWFWGIEELYYGQKQVMELVFHGGKII